MMDCGALPLFVCWWVARVPCGVFFGWWLLVGLDSYVPLVNGCGAGAMTLLVIAPGYLMACSASPSVSSPAL